MPALIADEHVLEGVTETQWRFVSWSRSEAMTNAAVL
tara:strand:+ start:1947 stop:2057 length:111 start_codon:yes stop_codon:yes gene_type:complete